MDINRKEEFETEQKNKLNNLENILTPSTFDVMEQVFSISQKQLTNLSNKSPEVFLPQISKTEEEYLKQFQKINNKSIDLQEIVDKNSKHITD